VSDIHPTAVIRGDVTIGSRTTIGPFVVVTGPVRIGDDSWLGAGAQVGAPPEVRSWAHPRTDDDPAGGGVVIGDRVVLREGAQVHHGWKSVTRVDDDAFVMNQAYVAHDCHVGSRATLASSVLLAGHVVVEPDANLGMATTVHQGRRVGRGAMVGMSSVVTRDVPPFAKAYGSPATLHGANVVGMQRQGYDPGAVELVTRAYSSPRPVLDDLVRDDRLAEAFRPWSSSGPS